MVSGTCCPYVSVCGCKVVRGAAALKSPMTYAVVIWASRMELGPGGWDWGLEAWIRALRLGFELQGCVSASKLRFELRGWDLKKEEGGFERSVGSKGTDDLCCFYLGLKDGIRAWRLE